MAFDIEVGSSFQEAFQKGLGLGAQGYLEKQKLKAIDEAEKKKNAREDQKKAEERARNENTIKKSMEVKNYLASNTNAKTEDIASHLRDLYGNDDGTYEAISLGNTAYLKDVENHQAQLATILGNLKTTAEMFPDKAQEVKNQIVEQGMKDGLFDEATGKSLLNATYTPNENTHTLSGVVMQDDLYDDKGKLLANKGDVGTVSLSLGGRPVGFVPVAPIQKSGAGKTPPDFYKDVSGAMKDLKLDEDTLASDVVSSFANELRPYVSSGYEAVQRGNSVYQSALAAYSQRVESGKIEDNPVNMKKFISNFMRDTLGDISGAEDPQAAISAAVKERLKKKEAERKEAKVVPERSTSFITALEEEPAKEKERRAKMQAAEERKKREEEARRSKFGTAAPLGSSGISTLGSSTLKKK